FWGDAILILPANKAMENAHHVPFLVKVGPTIVGVIGIAVAWLAYVRDTSIPAAAAKQHQMLYQFLLNKWYFDELYDRVFVRPASWLGRVFWKGGDGRIIDGLGPDGLAANVVRLAKRASLLQSGYVYHYAFAMLIGVAALVTYFFAATKGH
ncbi:MAG: NADH-quinone oxidoreductase subunit L, partial [Ferrovibrio sp.]|nr:NADH-quinone oxidoreductase subunit L [Ferrovibrio sp.]